VTTSLEILGAVIPRSVFTQPESDSALQNRRTVIGACESGASWAAHRSLFVVATGRHASARRRGGTSAAGRGSLKIRTGTFSQASRCQRYEPAAGAAVLGRNGPRDSKVGFTMRMAYLIISAGLCAIASGAWGGVIFYEKGGVEKTQSPAQSAERANKSDRLVRAFNVRGAVMPTFSVEIVGSGNAAVTVRNPDGSILYRVSPTERVTVVAKRALQKPVPEEIGSSDGARGLPDGCESPFSPFVEPAMANVIGRCVS
jgi:hypothetical protein